MVGGYWILSTVGLPVSYSSATFLHFAVCSWTSWGELKDGVVITSSSSHAKNLLCFEHFKLGSARETCQ